MADHSPASRRRYAVWAILLFAVVNLLMLTVYGVRDGGDTPMYRDGAARLLESRPLVGRQPSYLGYISVVAMFESVGAGLFGVALFQIALAVVAAAVVYSIGAALAGPVAGTIAAVLFSADVDTNRWHHFVLADSIYLSLFTIAVYVTHLATRRGAAAIAAAFALLIAASLVRPEGWFLIPAAALYIIAMRLHSALHRLVAVGAVIVVVAMMVGVLWPAASGNVTAVGPAQMLQRGQTIWEFDNWRVNMPVDPAFEDGVATSGDAVGFALRHPLATMTLMAARIGVHFAHVRPFYSMAHNAVIVLWLAPLYIAAAYGFWKLRRNALTLWILIAIATQTLVVALTHADWDGRYLSHVIPVLLPMAGAALAQVLGFFTPPELVRGEDA